jgi:hypothetical protein
MHSAPDGKPSDSENRGRGRLKRALTHSLGMALLCAVAMLALNAPSSFAGTFTGTISDSACGLQHSMAKNATACTNLCVRMGSKYVLVDGVHRKVYALSDQAKAKPFAGEAVTVVGALEESTIEVKSIRAIPPRR